MNTPGTEPQGVPSQDPVPHGYPQPPGPPFQGPPAYGPPSYGPPTRRWGGVVVGVAIGLAIGAGGLGLAWALSSGTNVDEDYDALCGLVVRTEPITRDFELADIRRLSGISELAAAMAETDSTHKPLAEALERSVQAAQVFDIDQTGSSLRHAQDICRA
ncbi:hypothetical protein CLV71_102103 [Actinophytocola oryzae]|uniref:Uncharacterized protein n=1 Tax=Actinophytocola oryzae TaxID=502181 RepID=A0A4R7W0W4_9PSEU|nr:hypothetical protein CLV71_102103 [Actinophytocola oryzae]